MFEQIKKLIEEDNECEYLDYKATSYRKENREALIKDILAMANSFSEEDKYIITGIKDCNGILEIVGLEVNDVTDDANYQQLILENIEPEVKFRYFTLTYNDKLLGVFRIFGNSDRPYVLKKATGSLRKGLCLMRKGSHQTEALRSDFDRMYLGKGRFEVRILEPCLSAVHIEEGCADIRVSIRNLTNYPVAIINGGLIVRNRNGEEISRHRVYGLDKFDGAEFIINMSPNSEQTGYLFLGFTSTDCLKLGLNSDGYTVETYIFELILVDTLKNNYKVVIEKGKILAKGKFLWKVQL